MLPKLLVPFLAMPDPSNSDAPLTVVGSQKAYETFLPAAQALPEGEVRPFRADASLAYHNIRRGLDAIAPHIERIKEELPKIAVGTELLTRLKPKGTKSKDPAEEAVKARDRLWTLLGKGHRDLRRVGMWLWADDVDEQVPPLQSRHVSARKKGEEG